MLGAWKLLWTSSNPFVLCLDDNVDVEPVENLTQHKVLQSVIVREVDRSFELGALNDDFNVETLVKNDGNGDGTHDIDDIPKGSKGDELDVLSRDEDEYTSRPSSPQKYFS